MATPTEKDFQQRVRKIEELVHGLEKINDPTAQAYTRELVQSLLELHGTGLERMLDVTYTTGGAAGAVIIENLAQDNLVSALLLLHGLHPHTLEERVLKALDTVRPYMKSHGGNVEFLGVTDDGVVKLKLEGSCHSCPSSRVTLKYAVEEAIALTAPDVTAIEAEGAADALSAIPNFVPIADLMGSLPPTPTTDSRGWIPVDGLASLKEGALRTLDMSGISVLFCHLGENYYAYGSTCPNCGQLLGQGKLLGMELTCLTCGHRFDIMRAGRDLDQHKLHLEPFPLLQEHGQVKVALHN